jgi:hypothetical protein
MATISTLSAGTQIAITEANYPAYYTLVHHNYNSGKAMLLRNASVGTSAWRTPASSTTSGNIF